MGKKPSWKDYQLIDAISKCNSFTEVAKYLKMSKSSNSILKRRSDELNLDYSHFKPSGIKAKPLNDILISSDTPIPSSHRLKLRLIKEGYFDHKCYYCGLTQWNGKSIPIELEHINGNRSDNRLENLTILCPNCHAQTKTYRGKNIKKYKNRISN